jgi:hypothetical protein
MDHEGIDGNTLALPAFSGSKSAARRHRGDAQLYKSGALETPS